jgi:hypothetical protein
MKKKWMSPIGIVVLSFVPSAHALEGYFAGAGTLLVASPRHGLALERLKVQITAIEPRRCRVVTVDGRLISKPVIEAAPSDPVFSPDLRGAIAASVACKQGRDFNLPKYEAEYPYRAAIQATLSSPRDASKIPLSFGVPHWRHEVLPGTDSKSVFIPGMRAITASVNGRKVPDVQERILTTSPGAPDADLADSLFPAVNLAKKAVTFAWDQDFTAGKPLRVDAAYEFGNDIDLCFHVGGVLPANLPIWFDRRPGNLSDRERQCVSTVQSAIVYLYPPKNSFQKAPGQVSVKFVRPKSLPMTFFFTKTKGLSCIDSSSLTFEWKNEWPAGELKVSYPIFKPGAVPESIRNEDELAKWAGLIKAVSPQDPAEPFLGGVKLGCAFLKDLRTRTGNPSVLAGLRCVTACP